MYSDNKQIRDVADVAAKIMYGQQPVTEKLHPNQQQLDVHEPEKDELTADDFKKLRAKKEVKKEEVEAIDEDKYDRMLSSMLKGKYGERLLKKHSAAVKRDKDIESGKTLNKLVKKNPGVLKTYSDAVKRDKKIYGEEVEELDELSKDTLGSYIKKANYAGGMADFKHGRIADKRGDSKEKTALAATSHKRTKGISTAVDKLSKEEVEQMDEVKMADLPSTKVQGRSYGASKPEPHAVDTLRGPKEKELKDIEAEKKKKQKKFSEMVNLYQEKGLKSLSEMLVKEEPDNEQFTKEFEEAKAKSEGKGKKAEVAKAAVQAVKQEGTEITDEMIFEVLENAGIDFESLDDDELQVVANEAYEILDELSKEELDEREMTDAEMKKREDIVKGMKKGMAGFKERYGDRAKNVMYATANKQAIKD